MRAKMKRGEKQSFFAATEVLLGEGQWKRTILQMQFIFHEKTILKSCSYRPVCKDDLAIPFLLPQKRKKKVMGLTVSILLIELRMDSEFQSDIYMYLISLNIHVLCGGFTVMHAFCQMLVYIHGPIHANCSD